MVVRSSRLDEPCAHAMAGHPSTLVMRCAARRGGGVAGRHDGVRDELAMVARMALTEAPYSVETEVYLAQPQVGILGATNPATQASVANAGGDGGQSAEPQRDRMDLRLRGLQVSSDLTDIDVRIFHPDAQSYRSRSLQSLFETHEKEKRQRYKEACQSARSSFVPFVLTTDGALNEAANDLVKALAKKLHKKWKRTMGRWSGEYGRSSR